MDKYGVVGNPISHSLSPRIHGAFAAETGQDIYYQALQFNSSTFDVQLRELQSIGYRGVNITVPFKEQAWKLADKLSPRAQDAKAVNTIIFQDDGRIVGDNTDGIGLTRDLIINNDVLVTHRKILILGAGGAVRGILGPLLSRKPDLVVIANRTLHNAERLAEDFFHIGALETSSFEDLGDEKFDLIINGTSAGLDGEVPPIPERVLGVNSICYDLMYDIDKPTAFVAWAERLGALRAFDGLGMLVEQAAESFYIWRGVRPTTTDVIAKLRNQTL